MPCIMHWPGRIKAGGVCGELATSLDFYPTLAKLAGADIPTDRIIDGKDISSLLFGENRTSPRDTFFYYLLNNLEAVRNRKWKLHVRKGKDAIRELYDLEADPGETRNLFDAHPGVVQDLMAALDSCRKDIGDEATRVKGRNTRTIGRVACADTLTHYDPGHPYIIALYDLKDRG